METLPVSKLIKNQEKMFIVGGFRIDGGCGKMKIEIRYDDRCRNGHNTFSITATIYRDNREWVSGCAHDDIAQFAPEFEKYIKWHLCSSNGPLYYIANTTRHALEHGPTQAYLYFEDKENGIDSKCLKYGTVNEIQKIVESNPSVYSIVVDEKTAKHANIEAARKSAIWPDATLEQLQSKELLAARLPDLMFEFKECVESLGFEY